MTPGEIESLRDWITFGFTIAFWIWFAILSWTTVRLAISAVRYHGKASNSE